MKTEAMERLLHVCRALTTERDREALLSSILDTGMDMTGCDAGTLYLLEKDGLRFCRMVTRSLGIREGGHDAPVSMPPVPLDERYVCAWAALHARTVNTADIHGDTRFDFTGSLQYDAMTGYETVSMLVVPMTNDKSEVIGVMQLINALDGTGTVIPFDPEAGQWIEALASQAAICITNMQYTEQISSLLDSLVRALSKAIDERSRYTANHTRIMAALAERFLDWLETSDTDWQFDGDRRRAFLMSVWLHDTGKLAIPLEVMDKATRLGALLPDVEERVRAAGLLNQIAFLENRISAEESEHHKEELEQILAFVLRVNRGGFLSEEDRAYIERLSEYTFTDENGETKPLLTEEELDCLRIPKGTLTAQERSTMESHAAITERILGSVAFPPLFSQVPVWASGHHEFLSGKGYPAHLSGKEIPKETRLLTILDIFEALTASDRPYKKPIPPAKALLILEEMAKEGSLDEEVLTLFQESRAWEGVI